jgi:SDR family mycofactocin-dependent oxidoreductase
MGKLEGRVAFITGGARGQGRSHALTLAREGADIVMMDNCEVDVPFQPYPGGSREQFLETQELLEKMDRRCIAVVGDVRDPADLRGAVGRAVDEFGRLDIAVANAGTCPTLAPLVDVSPEQWSLTIDTNLTGVYNTMQAVLPQMVAQKRGRIIATSSIGGRAGFANGAAYCASKWGVIGLVKSVANEYGMYGITVNAVCPTNVNSPMLHSQNSYNMYVPEVQNPTREQAEERMRQGHPLRIPYIEPQDISEAILFLASDEARYITAEALAVSAGLLAMNTA